MGEAGSSQAGSSSAALRPRRSVLYMPGANARALEKAQGLAADSLILDLEDAVAPDAKAEARDRVVDAVTSGAYGGRELTIRVVVPKVNSPADVAAIEAGLVSGGAPDHTKIWAMVETPQAMLDCANIAAASERLTVLVMGTNDLAKELHAEHVPGRQPLLTGLGLCLLAARATGKVILDGVYNDVRDLEGFAAECRQGAAMGFDGKTLIHPGQLEAANAAFAPDDDEIAASREIIESFEAAEREGRGVATVNGRMIENLHVENAQRVLAMADAIAAAGG